MELIGIQAMSNDRHDKHFLGVLIEKTLMYIFSKIQLFEVQPCADPESHVRGWRADNSQTLNSGLVALCPPSGSAHDNQGSVLKVLCQNQREHR